MIYQLKAVKGIYQRVGYKFKYLLKVCFLLFLCCLLLQMQLLYIGIESKIMYCFTLLRNNYYLAISPNVTTWTKWSLEFTTPSTARYMMLGFEGFDIFKENLKKAKKVAISLLVSRVSYLMTQLYMKMELFHNLLLFPTRYYKLLGTYPAQQCLLLISGIWFEVQSISSIYHFKTHTFKQIELDDYFYTYDVVEFTSTSMDLLIGVSLLFILC